MRVKFQYVDWTEWEDIPENAHLSPDKGVVRMWAIGVLDTTLDQGKSYKRSKWLKL